MARKPIDLTGDRYGRLVVLYELLPRISKERYWYCECDCGNIVRISQSNLRRTGSSTVSCGCYRSERIISMNQENTIHGMCKHPLYCTWSCMKQRCYNPNNISYEYYGARGITICDEWFNNSKSFIEWGLSNGWANGLTIDRIDSNKGYFPNNCRFVTMKEQCETKNPRYTFKHKLSN